MRILVAEDERDILLQYELALKGSGHDVTSTSDGEECLKAYMKETQRGTLIDVLVLDHRMPKVDGMEVARHVLAAYPRQRIIFASAYVEETLADSVKQLGQIVELIQKPFDLDTLVDMVEDKDIYEKLEKLNVKVQEIKILDPTHAQVRDLLEGLTRLRKTKTS